MNSRIRMRSLSLLVTAALVGGCALSSPYVKVAHESEPQTFCSDKGCSIDNAIAYSRAVRAAYRGVLEHYARLRSDSGGGIIGLGAAALAAAAGGAHKDVLVGLGLIGATTLGYSTWYGNAPRETLFLSTTQALVCAEAVTSKMRLPQRVRDQATKQFDDGNKLFEKINSHAAALDAANNRLKVEAVEIQKEREKLALQLNPLNDKGDKLSVSEKKKLEKLKAESTSLEAIKTLVSDRVARADTLLNSVNAAAEEFQSANSAYLAREHSAEIAGYDLVSAVDRIVMNTDVEAQKTLPDPDAAFAIVAGLGSVAAKFSPSADALAALNAAAGVGLQAESDSTVDKAAIASRPSALGLINDVATHHHNLNFALIQLRAISKNLAALAAAPTFDSGAVTSVDKCTIAGLSAMTASPNPISLAKETAASIPVDIRGGKPPYIVEVGSAPLEGVTHTQPGFAGSRFVVTTTDAVDVGTMTFKVTDGSGRILEIPANVAGE